MRSGLAVPIARIKKNVVVFSCFVDCSEACNARYPLFLIPRDGVTYAYIKKEKKDKAHE